MENTGIHHEQICIFGNKKDVIGLLKAGENDWADSEEWKEFLEVIILVNSASDFLLRLKD